MANIITGTSGADTLSGTSASDIIYGLGGNDFINSGLGNDTIDGGADTDGLQVDYSSATSGIITILDAATTSGKITAGSNSVTFSSIERFIISGTAYSDIFTGGNGNDVLNGYDLFSGVSGGNDTLSGGAGHDILDVGLSTGNNILSGGTGDDFLDARGSTGNNILSGGVGNDMLDAGLSTGNNSLSGGAGDDKLSVGSGRNTVNGGAGTDGLQVDYSSARSGITTNLDKSITNGKITAGSSSVTFSSIERFEIQGTDYSDMLIGGNGNDTLDGVVGNDTLRGGAGDDNLSVGSGKSTVAGGAGTDELSIYFSGTSGITTTLDAATANGTITAGSNSVTFSSIERFYIGGTEYNDNILGGNGNDTLSGRNSGNDTLSGGAGDDSFWAYLSAGNKILNGGTGDDSLDVSGSSGDNILNGGAGNDSLDASKYVDDIGVLTSGNNILSGGVGNDFLDASFATGNNILSGGSGNDTLNAYGSTGNNTLSGGTGTDQLLINYFFATSGITIDASTTSGRITAGSSSVVFSSIEQFDITGTGYNDNILGGNGNDSLNGYRGNDTLSGGAGDDKLSVELGKSTVAGGAGTDELSIYFSGTSGITATTLDASTTSGMITAGSKSVTFNSIEQFNILGTRYNDNILGGNGNDTLDAGPGGNDSVSGGAGTDELFIDYYSATNGIITTLDASTTSGTITAGSKSVTFNSIEQFKIYGTEYSDTLIGGNGDDTLRGSYGKDTLTGGNGADRFEFVSRDDGVDKITDFTVSQGDKIIIAGYGFDNELIPGAAITSEQFVQGTAAQDANDRFIYDIATGTLSYDYDGTGSGDLVQLATLNTKPTLTNNNILVA